MLNAVGPRPAPILLEQEIAGKPRADGEGANEKEHDRGRHRHRRAGKYELAEDSKDGGEQEKKGNPVGGAADEIPLVIDGERELGALMIEEPIGDLQIPQGIGGEQGPQRKTKRNG